MPDLPAAAGHRSCAGEGTRAVGRRRQRATSTSCRGLAVTVARPRPPGGRRRRSPSRPARCCTCPTSSAPSSGPRWPATLDRLLGGGGQVFFCNSGAEANECAIKLARKFGRPGPPRRGQRLRLVPRPHARHAPRHRPAGQARAVPAAARGLPPRRLGRPRRARAARSTRRSPPCCSSRCRARAASTRPPPSTSQGVRRLCDERGILFMVDEVQTGLGRTGRWFGFQHFGVVPDVVTMAKALGNGVPIGACWARADVAGAFEPGDHATTYGGQPLATAAARAVLRDHGGRGRARPGRARPGERLTDGARPLPAASADGAGPRPAARGRAGDGVDARAVAADAARRRAGRQRGHARPPSGSRRRCSSPTPRSTRRVGDPRATVLGGGAHDPPPPRGRRPDRRRAGRGPRPAPSDADAAAGRWPARASPCCSRSRRLAPATPREMAVVQLGGHPVYVRGRRGRPRRPRDGRGRRPHAGRLPRRHRRPGLRARRCSSGMAAVGRGPGRQPALRRRPPVQALADLLTIRQSFGGLDGPTRGLGRRLQQRGPLARARRRPLSAWRSGSPARRATARPTPTSTGSRALGRPTSMVDDRPARRRSRAPTSSTPTCGTSMGQEAEAERRGAGVRGLHRRRRADGGAPRRAPSSCTACRPTGARRSTAEVIDGPRSRVLAAGRQPHARRPRRCCLAARRAS